jgi:sugar phosphate isomerase/epimerase
MLDSGAVAYIPGLCSVTLPALSIDAVVGQAVAAGLEAIEWSARDHVLPGDLAAARKARAACTAASIDPTSYGSYFCAGWSERSDFTGIVETATELGAKNVRVWAGARGLAAEQASPHLIEAAIEALLGISAEAACAGLTVSVEYHRQTLADGADQALRLQATAGAANLFTYWQPLPGTRAAEAVSELRLLSPHLSHLHVFSWDADLQRYPLERHRELWTCALDAAWPSPRWTAKAAAFLEFVEGDCPDALARDAAVLRAWLQRPGNIRRREHP